MIIWGECPEPTPSINLAEGIKCATPMTMENEFNRASGTASCKQYITRAGCLGTGHSAEYERRFPVVIGGASGAIPPTATTRSRRGSTQQQETQPIETVSQAMLATTKTGKPRQRIKRNEEMNTFIMCQYYITAKLESIKIGYRRELSDRFKRQNPEIEISEQRIANQGRAVVTKGLLSKPWLEEIRTQVAETFKEENVNSVEETTQPTEENEQKEDSRRLEQILTAENPEIDKTKI